MVALGAAIQAGILAGEVKDAILLDANPFSLGIATLGGIFARIIDRDSTIPFKKTRTFTTASDGQSSVTVAVYQGNSDLVAENKLLAQFDFVGIAPAPKGGALINVTFDLNLDGSIEIFAGTATKEDLGVDEIPLPLEEAVIKSQQVLAISPNRRQQSDEKRYRIATFGGLSEIQVTQMQCDAGLVGVDAVKLIQPAKLDATPPMTVRDEPIEPPRTSVVSVHSTRSRRALTRPAIFVSYAHEDVSFAQNIEKALSLLVRSSKIDLWIDRKIKPGNEWELEIFSALERSNVAILLLSNDFLSSEFIVTRELPAIFSEKERRRLTLIPILVRPCPFELHSDLAKFQCFNNPEHPFASLKDWEMEVELTRLAREIDEATR